MNEMLGEIQRKLDLVRVIGVLLYTHLVHVITGVPPHVTSVFITRESVSR